MKNVLMAALMAASLPMVMPTTANAADAPAASPAKAGKMLYDGKGLRIASVNRVAHNGDAQVIVNGRLVTVPASTLSEADGKLMTSMSKADIARAQ